MPTDSTALLTPRVLLRRQLWAAAIISTTISLGASLQSLAMLNLRGERTAAWRILLFGLAQWWMWGVVGVLIWQHIQATSPAWSEWKRFLSRHLPIAIGNSILRAVVLSALGRRVFEAGDDVRPLQAWISSYLVSRAAIDVLIYFAIASASMMLLERQRAAERTRREERLAAQLVQAELRTLRMQLQPHFLFNTLHAIRVLVVEQPARAQQMIVLLGDLLRSTLLADGEPEVPLARELEFAQRYLDIEQIRFEDRLTVHIDISPELQSVPVPNFVLQPLVENAIHHGVGRTASPAEIRISARRENGRLLLDVWNTGAPLAVSPMLGVGISSTRARLARLHGDAARCDLSTVDGGVLARVTLPMQGGTT